MHAPHVYWEELLLPLPPFYLYRTACIIDKYYAMYTSFNNKYTFIIHSSTLINNAFRQVIYVVEYLHTLQYVITAICFFYMQTLDTEEQRAPTCIFYYSISITYDKRKCTSNYFIVYMICFSSYFLRINNQNLKNK